MIGYYIHHQGSGHLHRAMAIARELHERVTGLSTLPRPASWTGDWVQLQPDDDASVVTDPDAGGYLHWAPAGDSGVSVRANQLSRWLDTARPSVFVADVSVEAALLARLHGVPVVSMAVPGIRTDTAHELGYGISRSLVGAWPAAATGLLVSSAAARVDAVGAISRFPISAQPPASGKRALVLAGTGDAIREPFPLETARREAPDWHWEVLGPESWVEEPWELICTATVIITHAGQNALAEVAAARRPAIVVPRARPFNEQLASAQALARGPWPAIVLDRLPRTGWRDILERAAALDGAAWSTWNDGSGASRAARLIESAAA